MKAILLNNYGVENNARYQQTPTPQIKADEVLVKIRAAGVNHLDIGIASGAMKNAFQIPFPWIPGMDFAGIIEYIGADVHHYKIGDEIYGFKLDGGAYAQYIAVSTDQIAPKPQSLDFPQSASVPVAAATAKQIVEKVAHISSGQTLFILGASGAVGNYMIQIAHQSGAKVIVTASPRHAAYLKSLGADEVIDRGETFETKAGKVDAVVDLVGGSLQQHAYPVVKEGGILVSVNQPVSEDLASQYHIKATFSQLQTSAQDLKEIAAAIDAGELKIAVGNIYPIDKTQDAWDELMGKPATKIQKKEGRIVLAVE